MDPLGQVVATTGNQEEEILYADIDLRKVEEARK